MKIVCYGDSLTVGRPGVSYVDLLAQRLPHYRMVQHAFGGATVRSLQQTIFKRRLGEPTEITVVWVGVNDMLVHVNDHYRLIKRLLGQEWATGKHDIRHRYHSLLDNLAPYADHLIAISPLLVGEEDNRWNRRLAAYADALRAVCDEYDKAIYLDVRTPILEELQRLPTSSYVPRRAWRVVLDALLLNTADRVDRVAARRGLVFTLDGVHLNSRGAQFVADHLATLIQSLPVIQRKKLVSR